MEKREIKKRTGQETTHSMAKKLNNNIQWGFRGNHVETMRIHEILYHHHHHHRDNTPTTSWTQVYSIVKQKIADIKKLS